MSHQGNAAHTGEESLTREQLLDELHAIAALEHAHCVYYLRLHYALGGDASQSFDEVPAAVREAAATAFSTAFSEMFHFRDVNRVLVRAGREPVLERAAQVTSESGAPIELNPMTPEHFEPFPERERVLAAAVDRKYIHVQGVLASPTPPISGDLLHDLTRVVAGMNHASPPLALAETLAGLTPSEYLLITGLEPADELDRRLVALSDEFYDSLIAILRQHFAQVDGLGPPLRQQAVSKMADLHKINGLLGLRGMMPPFMARGMRAEESSA